MDQIEDNRAEVAKVDSLGVLELWRFLLMWWRKRGLEEESEPILCPNSHFSNMSLVAQGL